MASTGKNKFQDNNTMQQHSVEDSNNTLQPSELSSQVAAVDTDEFAAENQLLQEPLVGQAISVTRVGGESNRQEDRKAFEEERRVVLENMVVQLQGVIERMARANRGLERMTSKAECVKDVATLWRESYGISQEIREQVGDSTKDDHNRTSLHAFPRGLN